MLTLYFDSSRLGGLGGDALNSIADDRNVRLSPDQAELFFSSRRLGLTYQIWRSRRECL